MNVIDGNRVNYRIRDEMIALMVITFHVSLVDELGGGLMVSLRN